MPDCRVCRRANGEGLEYCDFCGHSLAAPPIAARATKLDGPTITCTRCRRPNPVDPSRDFCEFCGTPFRDESRGLKHVMGLPPRPKPVPIEDPTAVTCLSCRRTTRPSDDPYCDFCGEPVPGTARVTSRVTTLDEPPVKRPVGERPDFEPGTPVILCTACNEPNVNRDRTCWVCGANMPR